MVDNINYLAVITRLDVAHTAQKLAKFLTNLGPTYCTATEKCIRYMYKTRYLALSFRLEDINLVLQSTTDSRLRDFKASSNASYRDCPQTRKSTQGYVFSFFGGVID
jgi:hypothetical protein